MPSIFQNEVQQSNAHAIAFLMSQTCAMHLPEQDASII